MKIRKGDWVVDTKSFIDLKFEKGIPRLIVHERFERIIKWTLRLLMVIGIATSVISLKWYQSFILSLCLVAIEQFFERTVFQYTTIVLQKMPEFQIDGKRWKTMGFSFTAEKDAKYPPHVGPAFDDEQYARNFFNLIKSWNNTGAEDNENNIVLSFVMEPNSTYTVFIYANLDRKNLNAQFKKVEDKIKYEKYGKTNQQLIMQITFAHNFEYSPTRLIHRFLTNYSNTETFYLTPFVTNPKTNELLILNSLSIKKFSYKLKRRENLTPLDPEYNITIKKFQNPD